MQSHAVTKPLVRGGSVIADGGTRHLGLDLGGTDLTVAVVELAGGTFTALSREPTPGWTSSTHANRA